MIQRTSYLEKLNRVKDKQIIKVLTGVRVVGSPQFYKCFGNNYLMKELNNLRLFLLILRT